MPVTVTVYVPGVVAVLVGADEVDGSGVFCVLLLPPHPLAAATTMAANSRHIMPCHLRRGMGIQKNARAAIMPPPSPIGPCF
jgi:hypothetical protein